MQSKYNPITEGVIWKQILFFFFPMLLSSFFQQLYNTADALIVGRIAGKEALSAVGGSAGSVLGIFIMFYIGFSGGAAVLAAQFFGAKKEEALQESIRSSLLLSALMGAIGSFICFGFAGPILRLMHTPADILAPSLWYLRIVALGLIPNALYNMGASLLRATGDARRPLAVLVATCLTNILLDLLFVAGLGLGAPGAALATALCQLLSALLALACLGRSASVKDSGSVKGPGSAAVFDSVNDSASVKGSASVKAPDFTAVSDSLNNSASVKGSASVDAESGTGSLPDPPITNGSASRRLRVRGRRTDNILPRLLQMGLPLGFSEVMYTFANVILMSVVNGFGTDTVAAYAAYGKIDAIFWMIVGSFGVAITTFVGQNMGAGKWSRVMQSIRDCALMMFLILGIVIFLLRTFAFPLQRLFCEDPAVVEIGVRMMRFLMPFYFFYIPIEVLFGALRGMGDSVIPTLITFFGVCVLRSCWGLFIVPLHHTVNMVLLGFPVTWVTCDLAFAVYFCLYLRRHRPVFADPVADR